MTALRPSFFAVWVMLLAGCDDPPRPQAVVDAGQPLAPPPAPAREGCARSGAFETLETDPACVVKQASEEVVRAALKQLTITLDAEPAEVVAGGTSLLTLTLKNTSASEATVFLEARPRLPGPRTDWSRVAGIPEPRPVTAEIPHLLFPTTTEGSDGRDVDAVPTLSANGATPLPTLLAVHLRPGAKLTRTASWWALRIPAPAPIVTDDAGHRFIPKTTAQNLFPGDYTVNVDLPFPGLSREERHVSTRIHVTRTPLPDGGLRRLF